MGKYPEIEEKMEKRIKTVWILTIITAILIIGGQGYLASPPILLFNENIHAGTA